MTVEAVVDRLLIRDRRSYSLDGVIVPFPDPVGEFDELGDWARAVEYVLARVIYESHYLGVAAGTPASTNRIATIRHSDVADFADRLRDSNRASHFVSRGWRITGRRGGDYLVHNGQVELVATREEVVPGVEGDVGVRFPASLPYMSPGFFTAVSQAGPPLRSTPAVRIYTNLVSHQAAELMTAFSGYTRATSVQAMFKVLNDPSRYGRPDASVALISHREWIVRKGELRELFTPFASQRPRPAFTMSWLPGIGVASHPHSSRVVSFGEHRSQLVANALVEVFRQQESRPRPEGPSTRTTASIVRQALRNEGFDPDHLYLEPGWIDAL